MCASVCVCVYINLDSVKSSIFIDPTPSGQMASPAPLASVGSTLRLFLSPTLPSICHSHCFGSLPLPLPPLTLRLSERVRHFSCALFLCSFFMFTRFICYPPSTCTQLSRFFAVVVSVSMLLLFLFLLLLLISIFKMGVMTV